MPIGTESAPSGPLESPVPGGDVSGAGGGPSGPVPGNETGGVGAGEGGNTASEGGDAGAVANGGGAANNGGAANSGGAAAVGDSPQVNGLTTNGRVNPLGIPGSSPVFGWKSRSARRGVVQVAYEIQVGSSPGAEDVWASGRIESDQQVNVAYGGPALVPGARYHWRVRIWDPDLESGWSAAAWFETGLLSAADWGSAAWIGKPGGSQPGIAPLLRTEFTTTADKTVQSARIYASAHGVYELYLNGNRVGDQFFAPGYTEYAVRIQSQSYDVTAFVTQGGNALGAALGDGWWAGRVGLEGKGQYGTDLALVTRLKLTYDDGEEQWVDTDSGWTWAPGPFVANDLQLGETYDANAEQAGWDQPGFDDSAWQAVTVHPSDTAKLSPQPDEPVRQTAILQTVAVTQPADGVTVYDLGQNMVGVPQVTMTGRAGETARFRHAEVLNPDGTMYTANLRLALATDEYTFAADGTVTYRPTFTQHGFRYIEISGLTTAPPAQDVQGVVLGSDLPRTGTLETSNELLNQLLSNIAWSARGNFLSIPTDTPARDERLGWTGDISIFAQTASYLSDTRAFLGKWLIDARDEQKPSGGLTAVVPSTNNMFDMSAVGWEDAMITVPHSLWRGYRDARVIEEHYEAMSRFFTYARDSAGSDNLETGRLSFFTGDWLHLEDPSDQGVLGTAIWAQDVRMMAEMAAAVGRDTEAAEYAALYQDVRESFTAAYVSDDGVVLGGSQTGYALALGMDLITDAGKRSGAGERYVAKLAESDNHLKTGFIGTPWLLPALTNIGRDDLAYQMLLQDTYPSWGYEIRNGATTIWERWNSIQPDGSFGPVDMNSFNHYAYGAVGDWVFQNVGGLRPKDAGYRASIIEPRPGGGLTWAEANLETVYGPLSCAWEVLADGLAVQVTVPVNTTAEVRLPSTAPEAITEGGSPLADVEGIQSVTYDSQTSKTIVTVGSGTYSFEAR